MNVILRATHRRPALAVVAAAAIVGLLAGCTSGSPDPANTSAVPAVPASTPAGPGKGSAPIVLRFDQEAVPATLEDTPPARQFAAMLPAKLDLRDPMGQAKSGRLPRPIDITGADTVTDPSVGEIYYWPDRATIAIFYVDLDQSVPPPGLVRLGRLDGGIDSIAAAGNRMLVRVYRADDTP